MDYKDYYKILGVAKTATKAEIKKAFKRLARKYHPDVSKESNAEEKFKEVNEAYEVLKDEENRASYDQFGSNWKAGQQSGFGGQGGFAGGDFGDFFESVFGAGSRQSGGHSGFGGFGGARQPQPQKGKDVVQNILVPLLDLIHGVNRTFSVGLPHTDVIGRTVLHEQRMNVKIPQGIQPGKSIRYKGKGHEGKNGGSNGDLLLKIQLDSHDYFELKENNDIYFNLPLTPWEAALGGKVKVPTPFGSIDLNIPKNMQSGKKMRIKGRGFPGEPNGNFYAVIQIVIPEDNEAQVELWNQLADKFDFDPREKYFK